MERVTGNIFRERIEARLALQLQNGSTINLINPKEFSHYLDAPALRPLFNAPAVAQRDGKALQLYWREQRRHAHYQRNVAYQRAAAYQFLESAVAAEIPLLPVTRVRADAWIPKWKQGRQSTWLDEDAEAPSPSSPLPDTPCHGAVGLIQQTTANYYGVPLEELMGPSRDRIRTMPRQVAMYLGREMTGLSYPALAERFVRGDHTTVMHAHRKIGSLLQEDQALAGDVAKLKERLTRDLAAIGRPVDTIVRKWVRPTHEGSIVERVVSGSNTQKSTAREV